MADTNAAPMTVTTAATMTAASLAPAIAWALNGFAKPVPDGVALTLGACLIIAAHGMQKVAAAWYARRLASPPDVPPAPPQPPAAAAPAA